MSADEVDLAGIVIADVDAVNPGLAFLDIAFEDLPDRRVIDAVPGNVLGREVWEESGVRAEILSPYSIFSVPKISEVYIIFRAVALEITGQYGPETLDYKFFAPEDIPWDSIYYPAIRQILERYIEERQAGVYGIYIGNDDSGKIHFIR